MKSLKADNNGAAYFSKWSRGPPGRLRQPIARGALPPPHRLQRLALLAGASAPRQLGAGSLCAPDTSRRARRYRTTLSLHTHALPRSLVTRVTSPSVCHPLTLSYTRSPSLSTLLLPAASCADHSHTNHALEPSPPRCPPPALRRLFCTFFWVCSVI